MQDKTCKFLAVVFALSLTLVHNPSVSQASSNDLAASNAALLRQMNRMEQRIDQDWQTQRRFFSNWMNQSLTALTDTDTSLANIHSNGHTVYYDAANEANAWLQGQTKQLPGGGKLTPQAKPTEK